MNQRIYLIRHGMREDFEDPTWPQRSTRPYDTPLSATGFRQAEDVGRALKDQGIQAIYSSPFLRALQTADAIAAALDLPIRVEHAFAEWLNPVWWTVVPQLPDTAEAHRQFPRVDLSYKSMGQAIYPEVDETKEVFQRVGHAWSIILSRNPPENVAIVAHGSPLGQTCGHLIPGVPGVQMQVASITRVDRIGDRFQLIHSGIEHLRDQNKEVRFH